MTEDEAITKWCPFARSRTIRYDLPGGHKACTSYMEHGFDTPTTTCIGSACMAWRIRPPDKLQEQDPIKYPPIGYCGLAGKL